MQGDVVKAARWLGTSIVLASVILVGGMLRARTGARDLPSDEPAPRPRQQAQPLDSPTPPPPAPECTTAREATDGGPILNPLPVDGITGAMPSGVCRETPSEREILETLPKFKNGSPFYETERDDVHVEVEKIGEHVDACKVYPLAGPCRLVHCHYKCTVTFDELSWSDYPVPFSHADHKVEVIYVEKDFLRRCASPDHAATAPGHSAP